MMLLLLAAVLSFVAVVAFAVKFATADGDFTLISRGPAKRKEVERKVVWITGASRGIDGWKDQWNIRFGESEEVDAREVLAKQFVDLGAKVILSARNKSELERVRSDILTTLPNAYVEVLPMDLASGEESLQEAVQIAESLFSNAGVDYMVHNAAFERLKRKALEETEESLQATMNTNVMGPITLTRLLAHCMIKRGKGHFIVMSSAAGKVPAPGQAMYTVSKHALNGYFHTLRSELREKGIQITVICPGPINTSRVRGTASSEQNSSSKTRLSSKRCAELTIIAATHGLKEAWISYQPVLLVMYLVQYMPTVGYWLMDKIGADRLNAAEKKRDIYGWNLLFGQKST